MKTAGLKIIILMPLRIVREVLSEWLVMTDKQQSRPSVDPDQSITPLGAESLINTEESSLT
jgi:hypothetical protein